MTDFGEPWSTESNQEIVRDNSCQVVAQGIPSRYRDRVVACVNACKGIPGNGLKALAAKSVTLVESEYLDKLRAQRDRLLEASKAILERVDRDTAEALDIGNGCPKCGLPAKLTSSLRAAIKEVEGEG